MRDDLIVPPVLVVGPDGDADLSELPGPVAVVQDRQPDHDRHARSFEMRARIEGPAATVVVALPRSRTEARDRIARAVALGVPVIVDGQKTDGADSMLKDCRARGTVGEVISKAHGKLFVLKGGDFDDWIAKPGEVDGFVVPPGGFSADGIDKGTAALIEALPPLKGHVVDLGAGWGALSRAILAMPDVATLDLVEAHRPSLDAARETLADDRARFHWADATTWQPDTAVDAVVTNPPFHKGRAGSPDLGRAFIATAAQALKPRGTLWLVANRHLPYEASLGERFAEVETLPIPGPFKIFRAARPRRPR